MTARSLALEIPIPLLEWLPGETFFSLCSRHHRLSGFAASSCTTQALFGHSRSGSQHDFPSRLDEFVSRTDARGALPHPPRLGGLSMSLDNRSIVSSVTAGVMRGRCVRLAQDCLADATEMTPPNYPAIEAQARSLVAQITAAAVDRYLSLIGAITSIGPSACGSSAFQQTYHDFFALGPARLSPAYLATYYQLMQSTLSTGPQPMTAIDIGQVATKLYGTACTLSGAQKLQYSFASKLAHMANQNLPIHDSLVAIVFSFRAPTYGTMPQKLAKLDAFMAYLIEEYSRVLSHGHLQNCLREFDRQYPKAKGITPVKKVDFVLWTYGRLLKQAQKAARSAPKRP